MPERVLPFDQAERTEAVLRDFCQEFVENPYLCYTEHGLHALFFARLYEAFESEEQRYFYFEKQKVCVIQKEYPTHHNMERSRRQNWDISVIKVPLKIPSCEYAYDHFPLAAVVEFGMNYDEKHIRSDIQRLSHESSHVGYRLIAQLYRLGKNKRISKRTRSTRSKNVYSKGEILQLLQGNHVVVYYGLTDESGERTSGLWRLSAEGEQEILVLPPERPVTG